MKCFWYLICSGRRSWYKPLWLARFLHIFHHAEELHKSGSRWLSQDVRYQKGQSELDFVAPCDENAAALRMVVENHALAALHTTQKNHSKIHSLLVFDIHDAELLPRLERTMQLQEIRQLFDAALAIQDANFDKRRFGDFFSGSILPYSDQESIIFTVRSLSARYTLATICMAPKLPLCNMHSRNY
ncbi:MAG: hypothetical protein ACU837_16135 [Gammaproteobacteria bacterium]